MAGYPVVPVGVTIPLPAKQVAESSSHILILSPDNEIFISDRKDEKAFVKFEGIKFDFIFRTPRENNMVSENANKEVLKYFPSGVPPGFFGISDGKIFLISPSEIKEIPSPGYMISGCGCPGGESYTDKDGKFYRLMRGQWEHLTHPTMGKIMKTFGSNRGGMAIDENRSLFIIGMEVTPTPIKADTTAGFRYPDNSLYLAVGDGEILSLFSGMGSNLVEYKRFQLPSKIKKIVYDNRRIPLILTEDNRLFGESSNQGLFPYTDDELPELPYRGKILDIIDGEVGVIFIAEPSTIKPIDISKTAVIHVPQVGGMNINGTRVSIKDPIQISCCGNYTAIVTKEGKLYVSGKDFTMYPSLIPDGIFDDPWLIHADSVIEVSCDYLHLVFLNSSGQAFILGNYKFDRGFESASKPLLLQVPEKVIHVSTSENHALLLTETGKIYIWGMNNSGAFGIKKEQERIFSIPVHLDFPEKIVSISTGKGVSSLIGESGKLYVAGHNIYDWILMFEKEPVVKCVHGKELIQGSDAFITKSGKLYEISLVNKIPKINEFKIPSFLTDVAITHPNIITTVSDVGTIWTFGKVDILKPLGSESDNSTGIEFRSLGDVVKVCTGRNHTSVITTPVSVGTTEVSIEDQNENFLPPLLPEEIL